MKVWGAYYTSVRIIFEFLRYIKLVAECTFNTCDLWRSQVRHPPGREYQAMLIHLCA